MTVLFPQVPIRFLKYLNSTGIKYLDLKRKMALSSYDYNKRYSFFDLVKLSNDRSRCFFAFNQRRSIRDFNVSNGKPEVRYQIVETTGIVDVHFVSPNTIEVWGPITAIGHGIGILIKQVQNLFNTEVVQHSFKANLLDNIIKNPNTFITTYRRRIQSPDGKISNIETVKGANLSNSLPDDRQELLVIYGQTELWGDVFHFYIGIQTGAIVIFNNQKKLTDEHIIVFLDRYFYNKER